MKKYKLILLSAWFIINGIAIPFLWSTEKDYRTNEYVIKGRGSNAKVVKKSEDPDYYNARMKYFWTGYILIPLISGIFTYQGIRRLGKGKPNTGIDTDPAG